VCPKKDNPKKNFLHAIYALGYEPIESDISSNDELYEYCTETDSDVEKILGKGNLSATFIKIVLGNKKKLLAYIDTGATLCFGKKSISRNWERLAKPKEIIVANKSKHQIWFNLRDVSIKIEGYKFFIPTIYLHDSGLDLIIGNNF